MCGITAFLGPSAATRAREALARLEYRGYDSAGIAARRPDGTAVHVRTLEGVAALTRGFATGPDATTAAIAVEKFLTARKSGQPAPDPMPTLVRGA